ncbi:MAG: tetrahydromethanopterin S-methyltransferase subunit A [Candidatus Altiarchaeales archaeon]|nr:tetrahydromethanopterin S-methyltransferase subunit A [Candidatus Altiarchaeales archaeon]MBD3415731.1 tetrahydromethanopterin S-methyltransferase subunit A [Candidatus Altiarchaeales archaeon]
MCHGLYPWGGRFTEGDRMSCVAVVTLSEEFSLPLDKVALYGSMKTENLGVEKVVANVISNRNIRFLIVCGTEVRGHRSGEALICLHRNGVDSNHRVIGAKSAIPFIENLPADGLKRFREQVEVVDLIGVSELKAILDAVEDCTGRSPGPLDEAMMLEPVSSDRVLEVFHSEYALHSKVDVDLYGVVSPAPEAG